jgi:hypothetical protein
MPSRKPASNELKQLIQKTAEALKSTLDVQKAIREELARLGYAPLDLATKEPTTQFERIEAFLRSKGNKPQTSSAIMAATGISRGSLSQILYRTHKDRFVYHSITGYSRKKLWSLKGEVGNLPEPEQHSSESLQGKTAIECCEQIIRGHGNLPMNALTIAREAIRRGYRGKVEGGPDDVLMTTAKSFWARMGRDPRFFRVKSEVFRLRVAGDADSPERHQRALFEIEE